jgi:hypothetical protein
VKGKGKRCKKRENVKLKGYINSKRQQERLLLLLLFKLFIDFLLRLLHLRNTDKSCVISTVSNSVEER